VYNNKRRRRYCSTNIVLLFVNGRKKIPEYSIKKKHKQEEKLTLKTRERKRIHIYTYIYINIYIVITNPNEIAVARIEKDKKDG
jgi:hypothetical protein